MACQESFRGWLRGMMKLAWGLLVVSGFASLSFHTYAPGAPGSPPSVPPRGSAQSFEPGKFHLIVFAHPRCPCTRTTLRELARLLHRFGSDLSARVLFYRPEGTPETWGGSESWDLAWAIPGLEIEGDEGGRESSRFGVATSGHVLLFGPDGSRRFSGGITVGRGHEGENDGTDAIISILEHEAPRAATTPVFGCPITTPARTADDH